MKRVAEQISGYSYGSADVSRSEVTLRELEELKISVGWTEEDERYRRLAGEVLADQTERLVNYWRREIIGGIPNLARHSQSPGGEAIAEYSAKSGLRFQQWILDTCFRPYDREWLDYQQEIALRHTSLKKNQTDHVNSTPYVPLRDIIAFIAVMNETVRPYLAAKGHAVEEVEGMHRAWCRSLQLQAALWARPYVDGVRARNEW